MTESARGLGRKKTREEIGKGNQMTALRFQTGGGGRQTSQASLWGTDTRSELSIQTWETVCSNDPEQLSPFPAFGQKEACCKQVKSGRGNPHWDVSIFVIHLRKPKERCPNESSFRFGILSKFSLEDRRERDGSQVRRDEKRWGGKDPSKWW